MKFVVELLVIDHSCMAKIEPRNISEWLWCDVGEAPTLRKKGVKELFEIFINFRDTFVNIPVDEDQTILVPDPVRKILNNHLVPYKCIFFRTTDTSPREEVKTYPNSELLTGLKQIWKRFLTTFKKKLLVSCISKVTVVQQLCLIMTMAIIFVMAINKETHEEQDRSF